MPEWYHLPVSGIAVCKVQWVLQKGSLHGPYPHKVYGLFKEMRSKAIDLTYTVTAGPAIPLNPPDNLIPRFPTCLSQTRTQSFCSRNLEFMHMLPLDTSPTL